MQNESSSFIKNIIKVLLGSTGAQAISFVTMLVIVRFYSPGEIGNFNVWLAFVSVLAVLVTGRYELALFSNQSNKKESAHIVKLVFLLAVILSLFLTGSVFLASSLGAPIPAIVNKYCAIIAIMIFGIGFNNTLISMLSLTKQFFKLGLARISMSAAIAASQILAGFLQLGTAGLIYGQVTGVLISTFLILFWLNKNWIISFIKTDLITVLQTAKKHRKYPQYSLPADLINTLSNHLSMILIGVRFGAEAAGFYALTIKIMGAPITLLSNSVLDVFKEQASTSHRLYGHSKEAFTHTLKLLFLLSILPTIVVFFFGKEIFTLLLGLEWGKSGVYAQYLIPMFFFRFIISPLSYTFYIAQKQNIDLIWQIGLLAATLGSFLIPDNPDTAIICFSISYSFMYGIYLYLSYKFSKGH